MELSPDGKHIDLFLSVYTGKTRYEIRAKLNTSQVAALVYQQRMVAMSAIRNKRAELDRDVELMTRDA